MLTERQAFVGDGDGVPGALGRIEAPGSDGRVGSVGRLGELGRAGTDGLGGGSFG